MVVLQRNSMWCVCGEWSGSRRPYFRDRYQRKGGLERLMRGRVLEDNAGGPFAKCLLEGGKRSGAKVVDYGSV